MTIEVVLLNENAKLPTKGSEEAAGYDLYCVEDIDVNPGCRVVIKTGISIKLKSGQVGLIWPRSGLAVKNGIAILAGVIDSDYRGELMVCVYNTDIPLKLGPDKYRVPETKHFKAGDRIAQLLIQDVINTEDFIQVEELSETEEFSTPTNASTTSTTCACS